MKKNILALACMLIIVASSLLSCGGREHYHTFSEEWYSDAEYHWHPATCEHSEQNTDFAPHLDELEDGICDICLLEVGHDHTFAAEWTTDEKHHWKQATCSHTNQKDENALHFDRDMNGSCDVCSYHVHDANAAGYCKHESCGEKVVEVDKNDLGKLVSAFLVQADKVNGGNIDYEVAISERNSQRYSAWSHKNISYTFGNNFAYYKTVTKSYNGNSDEYTDTQELWHEADGEETFSVEIIDGGDVNFIASDPDKLIGYYFSLSTLADGDGAENFLFNLYTASHGEKSIAKDVVDTLNPESNSGSFSFTVLVVQEIVVAHGDNAGKTIYNVNYYEVSVEFAYNEELVLTKLDTTLDRYTNDAGALDNGEQIKNEIDIEYDPESGTIKFVKYNPTTDKFEDADSAPSDRYTYSVSQTIGERIAENEHAKAKYIPDSFNLYYTLNDDGSLANKYNGEVIKADKSKAVKLYVGDCMPEVTSLQTVIPLVNSSLRVYRDGNLVENVTNYSNSTAVAMLSFGGTNCSFFFIGKQEGIYKLEISLYGKTLYTIQINVGNVIDQNVQLEDNQFAVRVTEAHEWANEVKFTAPESGIFYFNLPSGVGFIEADAYDIAEKAKDPSLYPKPYFDYNNSQIINGAYKPGSFSLSLEKGQTIRFYVNAAEKGLYVITYFS